MNKLALVLYLFGLPVDLLGALIAFVLAPFQRGGLGLRVERRPTGAGIWALSLDVDDLKSPRRARAIAPHVVLYRSGCHFPRGWSVLQEREHKRAQSAEVAGATGFAIALIGLAFGAPWWAALAMWAPSPWLFVIVSHLVTSIRGAEIERPSRNEEAAYALSAEAGKR